MKKFWELDEVPEKKFVSEEDAYVEQHYKKHIKRDELGRYMVKLPFNKNKEKLGDTFKLAEKRFYSLENRFKRNSDIKTQYIAAMREYINNGHMVETSPNEIKNQKCYFIPHQAVIKETSATTKIRIVLDASSPSSTGYSLNQALYKGRHLTPEVFQTLIHFHIPPIAFIADIQKMYHHIFVYPEDALYQLFLWREDERDELKIYKSIKVIFGESSAAYLAIRTIKQLADDEKPIASEIIKKRFHVDNLATGSSTLQEALKTRDDLIELLKRGGFLLRQWASNEKKLIESLPENLIYKSENNTIRALGILWDTKPDEIIYDVTNKEMYVFTMRTILSEIMKLNFDALGKTNPVKLLLKLIMQELWKLGISNWDKPVPEHIIKIFMQIQKELNEQKEYRFPRQTIILNFNELQIHGFCDASEKAYGVYLHTFV